MANQNPNDIVKESISTAKSQFSNNASENSRTKELNTESPNTTSKWSSSTGWAHTGGRKKDSFQKSNENHPSLNRFINEQCVEQCKKSLENNKLPSISEYSENKRRLNPPEMNDSLTRQGNEKYYNEPENEELKEQPNNEQLNKPAKSQGCCPWSSNKKTIIDEQRSRSLIEVGGRKVVKTELALAKIVFFDDLSKTYEIMNGSFQDKLMEKATYTSAVFVMQPEGLTMCFDCSNTVPRYSDIMIQPYTNLI